MNTVFDYRHLGVRSNCAPQFCTFQKYKCISAKVYIIETQLFCWFVTHCMTSSIQIVCIVQSEDAAWEMDGNSANFLLTHNCARLHYLPSAISHEWDTIQTEQYKPSLHLGHVIPSIPHAASCPCCWLTENKTSSVLSIAAVSVCCLVPDRSLDSCFSLKWA